MSEKSIAERLFTAERDILTARETLSLNLGYMQGVEYFLVPHIRKDFKNYMRTSQIELLRLNNALHQIENLKKEVPEFLDALLNKTVIRDKELHREITGNILRFRGEDDPSLAAQKATVSESMDFIDRHGE